MLDKSKIQSLIDDFLAEHPDLFVVDWSVNAENRIVVELESDTSTSVANCMAMSRAIEHNLDREEEDFALDVTSPGLDKPLRVMRQFKKNIGRTLKVTDVQGEVIEGELTEVTDSGIELKNRTKERIEGKKSKMWVDNTFTFAYGDIDKAFIVISFK